MGKPQDVNQSVTGSRLLHRAFLLRGMLDGALAGTGRWLAGMRVWMMTGILAEMLGWMLVGSLGCSLGCSLGRLRVSGDHSPPPPPGAVGAMGTACFHTKHKGDVELPIWSGCSALIRACDRHLSKVAALPWSGFVFTAVYPRPGALPGRCCGRNLPLSC